MFTPQRWARAFINSMGNDAEEAFEFFRLLVSWTGKLPGAVAGTSSAAQALALIKKAGENAGIASESLEGASHFIFILIKKNCLRHSEEITSEIQKLLDAKKNILPVIFESAFPSGGFENELAEAIKKNTGAGEIRFRNVVRPELIGGCRLRIGDRLIDASVLSQLKQMENSWKLAITEKFAGPGISADNPEKSGNRRNVND